MVPEDADFLEGPVSLKVSHTLPGILVSFSISCHSERTDSFSKHLWEAQVTAVLRPTKRNVFYLEGNTQHVLAQSGLLRDSYFWISGLLTPLGKNYPCSSYLWNPLLSPKQVLPLWAGNCTLSEHSWTGPAKASEQMPKAGKVDKQRYWICKASQQSNVHRQHM